MRYKFVLSWRTHKITCTPNLRRRNIKAERIITGVMHESGQRRVSRQKPHAQSRDIDISAGEHQNIREVTIMPAAPRGFAPLTHLQNAPSLDGLWPPFVSRCCIRWSFVGGRIRWGFRCKELEREIRRYMEPSMPLTRSLCERGSSRHVR